MRKTHILDTSTLVTDPTSFKNFPNSDVVIPIVVLHELDNLKKQPNEAGKNARVCIKLLDDLSSQGDVSKGILIEHDINIKIDVAYHKGNDNFGPVTYGDTQILLCAYDYFLANQNIKEVVLVSNDINLRVKAKAFGIEATGFNGTNFSLSDIYSGVTSIIDENVGMNLLNNNVIEDVFNLFPNEFIIFKNSQNEIISLGKKCYNGKIKLVKKNYPWSLTPRNKEQILAIDLLLDKNIDLVTLTGKAGTGKSLIVLACALELVLNKREYDKFIIYRPIQPVGNDIGFLPGDMGEKLAPWFQAVMDNLEFLLGGKNPDWKKDLELYQKKGRIEMEAITYIRGRSLPNSIILVDEAQNLSKDEIKTILTRAGENTKIILTGDIEQIDNSALDATSNGLTHVIERFKESEMTGHITFTQGERSKLASLAAQIL
jgi:PhoH-like ATPase